MKCQYCRGNCIKKGRLNGRQLYRCKVCSKYQRFTYVKRKVSKEKKEWIRQFSKEGLGTSSISRLLKISKSTVARMILRQATLIPKPIRDEQEEEYEMDELRTYISNKRNECWIMYAINKRTKEVIDFRLGKRTRVNISKVVDTIQQLNPKMIFTDKLNSYPGLIAKRIHNASPHKINHIERMNLNLRKDIKCLNRKTICYSKSQKMLEAKLVLYFFG